MALQARHATERRAGHGDPAGRCEARAWPEDGAVQAVQDRRIQDGRDWRAYTGQPPPSTPGKPKPSPSRG